MKPKKGNVMLDLLLVPIILVVIAVFFFLSFYIYNTVKDNTELFSGVAEGGSAVQEEIGVYSGVVFDMLPYIFIMVLVSVLVGLALTAYFIESSIVFLVVGFIFLIISLIISAPISNFYEDFIAVEDFSVTTSAFSITNLVMLNLPYFILIIGGVFLIVMFGKKHFETAGGGF